MERHFCSTTYLMDKTQQRTLLHWHRKLQTYLPPGGHLERNESPFEAAIREIEEEYGDLNVDFIHPVTPRQLDERSYIMEMPHLLISEDIAEGHIHMDWIFFAWIDPVNIEEAKWFSKEDLEKESEIFSNVRDLAIYAMNTFYPQK
ncbi:MAG: NUDIX domain-containing protein [Candidatus Heimdallarchaeota archaeon]|nr:NUDIX domain-containing protein [Candidatus Heimdallarchaeota archaeon]